MNKLLKLLLLLTLSHLTPSAFASEKQSSVLAEIDALNQKLSKESPNAELKKFGQTSSILSSGATTEGIRRLEVELFRPFKYHNKTETTTLAKQWAILADLCDESGVSLVVVVDDQAFVGISREKNLSSSQISITLPEFLKESGPISLSSVFEFQKKSKAKSMKSTHSVLSRLFAAALAGFKALRGGWLTSSVFFRSSFIFMSDRNKFDVVVDSLQNKPAEWKVRETYTEIDLVVSVGRDSGNFGIISRSDRRFGTDYIRTTNHLKYFIDFSKDINDSFIASAFYGYSSSLEEVIIRGEHQVYNRR